MSFLESYKRLDNLCKDLFQSNTGVTTYLSHLENIKYKSSSYDNDYINLRKYRKIRNSIVHDNSSNETNMCSDFDVRWIKEFHQRILTQTDPLALDRKKELSKIKISSPKAPTISIHHQIELDQLYKESIYLKIVLASSILLFLFLLVICVLLYLQ